jgi:hypothetical protein
MVDRRVNLVKADMFRCALAILFPNTIILTILFYYVWNGYGFEYFWNNVINTYRGNLGIFSGVISFPILYIYLSWPALKCFRSGGSIIQVSGSKIFVLDKKGFDISEVLSVHFKKRIFDRIFVFHMKNGIIVTVSVVHSNRSDEDLSYIAKNILNIEPIIRPI